VTKSYDAVFAPQKFEPFPRVSTANAFEKKWDKNKPWVLANMAHTAYHDSDRIKGLMTKLGATAVCCYDQDGAQAFLAVWPDKAILSFRGSQPRERNDPVAGKRAVKLAGAVMGLKLSDKMFSWLGSDVLADLKFPRRKFADDAAVKVHGGFLGEIKKLWKKDIAQGLKDHTRGRPVWVTGHSLGAAMATLAGMYHPFEAVMTFGEPRVGENIDRAFKAKSHIRYRNGNDPVTMVPPERPFGYDHHGDVVRISDPGGATDFRYDHAIVYYAENLNRAARRREA
jgi:triacylglycerol lipase